MTNDYRDLQIDVLARTMWGEARGEGLEGMEAVACVVLNRVAVAQAHGGRYWWGGTIVQVCQKPHQFSCWNKDDANWRKLLAVTPDTDISFRAAMSLAEMAVDGKLQDVTGGATHYHATYVRPKWADELDVAKMIGKHIFYKPKRKEISCSTCSTPSPKTRKASLPLSPASSQSPLRWLISSLKRLFSGSSPTS